MSFAFLRLLTPTPFSGNSEAFHAAGRNNSDFEVYRAYAKWKGIELPNYPTLPPTTNTLKWITT